MTVVRNKDCITFRYDFEWRGQRYQGTTHQTTQAEARDVEDQIRGRLRRQAGGILRPEDTPRFTNWADTYYTDAEKRVRAPRAIDDSLRVVLRFWGSKPGPRSTLKVEADAPYHDLRLGDPIEDPAWIVRFEDWVSARGVSANTRNHYFSVMSGMYRTALLPTFRKLTGVSVNPFVGIPKARTRPRNVTLTVEQIRAWLTEASYHIRLAAAIASLAPKLRVSNVLALEWGKHVDRTLSYITVYDHKTADKTGAPLVAPISRQLKRILEDAKKRRPESRYVVTYRGQRVYDIHGGVTAAFEGAGIPHGLKTPGGATFHTLRHSMSTLLAELDETEASRQALMGHEDPSTTKRYTHLRPVRERPAAERLSRAVKIADVVMRPELRATRQKGKSGGPVPARTSMRANSRQKMRRTG